MYRSVSILGLAPNDKIYMYQCIHDSFFFTKGFQKSWVKKVGTCPSCPQRNWRLCMQLRSGTFLTRTLSHLAKQCRRWAKALRSITVILTLNVNAISIWHWHWAFFISNYIFYRGSCYDSHAVRSLLPGIPGIPLFPAGPKTITGQEY